MAMQKPLESSQRAKRIGLAVLRILAEHALLSISGYGPYLKLGYDIFKVVKDEIRTEAGQQLTNDDIAYALHSLSDDQIEATVDSVLRSSEGIKATAKLSKPEREVVRRQLISLPHEYQTIIDGLERTERRMTEEASTKEQQQKDKQIHKLHDALKDHLKNNRLRKAFWTMRKIRKIDPGNAEILDVQAFLRNRGFTNFRELARQALFLASMGFIVMMTGFMLLLIYASQPYKTDIPQPLAVECLTPLGSCPLILSAPRGSFCQCVFPFGQIIAGAAQ
jgi:hypothetical protein